MHKIDWQPGEEGKGVVDINGVVHAWNEEEHNTHSCYMAANPHVSPISYFYVNPAGGVNITMPHPVYDGQEKHDQMMAVIKKADPHFHEGEQDHWTFA